METFGSLFRSALRHCRKAREYAQESNELAVASMVAAAHCHRIAAGIDEAVAEAARPYLELAQMNADLAESWAKTAEGCAAKVREHYLNQIAGGGIKELSPP